jgi:hypothetical protein
LTSVLLGGFVGALIAIDKVPGRRGWRGAMREELAKQPSQIVPKAPFKPHLIEEPIVIKVSDIRA